mgnify:CR=1 FL=1
MQVECVGLTAGTPFNEGDMVSTAPWSEESYLSGILALIRSLDANNRLVDMNSGGPANQFGLGDVNDQHMYTDPRDVPVVRLGLCLYGVEVCDCCTELSCLWRCVCRQRVSMEWSVNTRTLLPSCRVTSGSQAGATR